MNASETRKRRASSRRRAASPARYPSTTLTSAVPRTSQKCAGWCSQWTSASGLASRSTRPSQGKRERQEPAGHGGSTLTRQEQPERRRKCGHATLAPDRARAGRRRSRSRRGPDHLVLPPAAGGSDRRCRRAARLRRAARCEGRGADRAGRGPRHAPLRRRAARCSWPAPPRARPCSPSRAASRSSACRRCSAPASSSGARS